MTGSERQESLLLGPEAEDYYLKYDSRWSLTIRYLGYQSKQTLASLLAFSGAVTMSSLRIPDLFKVSLCSHSYLFSVCEQ